MDPVRMAGRTLLAVCMCYCSIALAQPAGFSSQDISALTSSGQWLELRKRMDEGIRLNVAGLNARYLRGIANYNLLDPVAAIPDLRAGAEYAPKSALPWVFLGRAYRRAGMIEPAIDAFKKALEIDPANAAAASLLWEA